MYMNVTYFYQNKLWVTRWVSYEKLELPVVSPEAVVNPVFLVGSVLIIFLLIRVVFFCVFFLGGGGFCLRSVSCVQCCLCPWTVHYWVSFCSSLTFMQTTFCRLSYYFVIKTNNIQISISETIYLNKNKLDFGDALTKILSTLHRIRVIYWFVSSRTNICCLSRTSRKMFSFTSCP